eukprot:CFRG0738T1
MGRKRQKINNNRSESASDGDKRPDRSDSRGNRRSNIHGHVQAYERGRGRARGRARARERRQNKPGGPNYVRCTDGGQPHDRHFNDCEHKCRIEDAEHNGIEDEDENHIPGFYYDKETKKHFYITDGNRTLFAEKTRLQKLQEQQKQTQDIPPPRLSWRSPRQFLTVPSTSAHKRKTTGPVTVGGYTRRWLAESGLGMATHAAKIESRTVSDLARRSAFCQKPVHLSIASHGPAVQRRSVYDFSTNNDNGCRGNFVCSASRLGQLEMHQIDLSTRSTRLHYHSQGGAVTSIRFQRTSSIAQDRDVPPALSFVEMSLTPSVGVFRYTREVGFAQAAKYKLPIPHRKQSSASGLWFVDWPLYTPDILVVSAFQGGRNRILKVSIETGAMLNAWKTQSRGESGGHSKSEMTCMRASRNGDSVVIGYRNGSIAAFDTRAGHETNNISTSSSRSAQTTQQNTSQTHSCNDYSDVFVRVREVSAPIQMASVASIHSMQDDIHVLVSRLGGELCLFDQRMWSKPVMRYIGHVNSHDFSLTPTMDPSESVVCCVGSDSVVRIWDVHSAKPVVERSWDGVKDSVGVVNGGLGGVGGRDWGPKIDPFAALYQTDWASPGYALGETTCWRRGVGREVKSEVGRQSEVPTAGIVMLGKSIHKLHWLPLI